MNAILEQINLAGLRFVEFALPMFVQSVVLIFILLLADFALRKKVRAVFRYWIWLLVLLKLVLPTSLSSPLSLGYFFGDRLTYVDRAETPPVPQANVVEPSPVSVPPFIDLSNIEADRFTPAAPPIIPVTDPAVTKLAAPPVILVTPLSWQGAVFLTWLTVVMAMLLLLLQRAIFVRGLVAQAKEANGFMADTLESCRVSMSVKRKLSFKISANATSPAVCGLFSPAILVPQNLASSLTAGQLKAVLLHELAHIRRGDLFVNLAQTILQIIYFYNPLLWLANCIIRRIREQAVDEMVLVAMGEKAPQYPQTLVSVAKLAFHRPVLSLRLIGVVESKSALSTRIKHILNRPMPKKAKLGIIGLLVVIIIGAILLPMANSMSGPPKLVIKGVVKDALTGEPIAGARVFDDGYGPEPVWEQIRPDVRCQWGAITNEAGQYSFLTWPEHHTIKVQAPGFKALRRSLYSGHFTFNKKDQEIFDFTLESEKVSDSSEFKKTLPNGVTVELIGVCEHPSEGKQWWRPDGGMLSSDQVPSEYSRMTVEPDETEQARELALRFSGPGVEHMSFRWKIVKASRSSSHPFYMTEKREKLKPQRNIVFKLPCDIETLDFNAGVAVGEWKKVASGGDGTTIIGTNDSLTDSSVIFHEAIKEKDILKLSATHLLGDAYDCRIMVVDRGDKLHEPSRSSNSGDDMRLCRGFFDVTPEQIKYILLQARPYQLVEFKNISLKPNFKTDVRVKVGKAKPETEVYIFTFKPIASFRPVSARKLLEAFNENHPDRVRTHHFHTEVKGKQLIGHICVDTESGRDAVINMLKQSDKLNLVSYRTGTPDALEKLYKMGQPGHKTDAQVEGEEAWGEVVEGLRVRWVHPNEPIVRGTAPVLTMEVENVSSKQIIWECSSGFTWGLNVHGVSPANSLTMPKFRVQVGSDASPEYPGGKTGPEPQPTDYYKLEPEGRIRLSCALPWVLPDSGQYTVNGVVWRRQSKTEGLEMGCSSLVLNVVNPTSASDKLAYWGAADTLTGLQLGLSFDLQARPYRQGEVISFKAHVRNTGDKIIKLVYFGLLGWGPTIFDSNGEIVSVWTPILGFPVQKQSLSLNPGEIQSVGSVFLELKPRPDTRWDGKSVYPRCYLTPGTYRISQKYRFADYPEANWHGELTTGELELTILRKPPDAKDESETDWVIEDYGQTRLLSDKEKPDTANWVSIWASAVKNKGRYLVPDRGLTLKELIKAAGYNRDKLALSYVELSRRSRQGNITACSTYSRNLKTLLSGKESDIVLKSHDSVLGGYIEPSANGVEFWSGYHFGEVVELTVNDDGAKVNMFADLDAGKLVTPPDILNFDDENAVLRWIKDNGIDVMGETAAGVNGLAGFNMYAARVDNYFWDAGPREVTDRLMVRIDDPVLLSVESLLPVTYLIKTSEYKLGILQILGFVENPKGIKIRYKLLNKEVAPKPDLQLGAKSSRTIQAVPLNTFEFKLFEKLLELVRKVERQYPDQADHWPSGAGFYHVDAQGNVTVWNYRALWRRDKDCAPNEVGWGSSRLVNAVGMFYLPDGTPLQSRWSERGGGMKDIRVKIDRTVGQDERVPLVHRHRLPSDCDMFSRDGLEKKILLISSRRVPLAIIVHVDRPMRLSGWWLGNVESDVQHFNDYDQLLVTGPPGNIDTPMLVTIELPKGMLADQQSDLQVETKPVSGDWQYIGQSIPPDFNDTMILAEHINLGSIGHDAERKTFITFIRDGQEAQNSQYRFVLFTKDGKILEPDGHIVLGENKRLEEKFTFDEPFITRQLKGFRFQSRSLPSSGIDNISSQLQKSTPVFDFETIIPSDLAPPGRYAVELDGVDDYLLVPDSLSLRLESPFTIEMWVKTKLPPDASEYRGGWAVISKGFTVGTPRAYLTGFGINIQRFPNEPSSLQIDFCKANNSGTYSATYAGYPLTNGVSDWIHITHVFDGEYYKSTPGHPLVMGKFLIPTNDPFKGLLGEVRLWNGARTRQELRQYENVALTGTEPGLAACWTFEQTKGQYAYDISGNNNHARLGKSIEADKADPKWVDLQAPSPQPDLKTELQVEAEKPQSLIFHGLDLTSVQHTTNFSKLQDLFEERPPGSKSFHIQKDVIAIYGGLDGTVYSIPRRNIFYVQHDKLGSSTLTYYGPFEGNPVQILNLQEDERRAVFPDLVIDRRYMAKEYSSEMDKAVNTYNKARRPFHELAINRVQFTEQMDRGSKQKFEGLAKTPNIYPVNLYAQRWLIIIEWLAEKTDTLAAAKKMTDLAEIQSDIYQANFTNLYAMLMLARNGYIDLAHDVFIQCQPELTPQWGWFVSALNQHFDRYVQNQEPDVSRVEGNRIIQKARTRQEWLKIESPLRTAQTAYADYLEFELLPMAVGYITSSQADKYSSIERVQLVGALRYIRVGHLSSFSIGATTSQIQYRLKRRIQPKVLAVWQRTLQLMDNRNEKEQIDAYSKEMRSICKKIDISEESLPSWWDKLIEDKKKVEVKVDFGNKNTGANIKKPDMQVND